MTGFPRRAQSGAAARAAGPSGPTRRSLGKLGPVVAAAALAVLVCSVYGQVGDHRFVRLDDEEYVSGNPAVLRGLTADGVAWAFTTFHSANWHPLTWISHMSDVALFGVDPGRHHLVNVVLHLLNTELLFLLLWRTTGGLWRSALAATVFGVHPLHVESVAWVAERKDLLSALFGFLAIGAYVRYARAPRAGRYAPVAVLFAMGLLCKPMLVTLPFVLLLLDFWPLGRLAAADTVARGSWPVARSTLIPRLLEKAPLLALSAASCVVTWLAQTRGGSIGSFAQISAGWRIANALVSYAAYLAKTAWPSSLSVFYPHPFDTIPPWKTAGAALLLAALSAAALRWGRRAPYLPAGWLWFLGTLVPVIGLAQVGWQARADRYTYIPLVGIGIAVSWGVGEIVAKRRHRRLALAAIGGLVVALSAAAWRQAGYWRDTATLFTRAQAVTERNWMAIGILGSESLERGRIDDAIALYRRAVDLNPRYVEAWNQLGSALYSAGRMPDAAACFREALRIQPGYPDAWHNLGLVAARSGEPAKAAGYFAEVLRRKPDHVGALVALGASYQRLGRTGEAIAQYGQALQIAPDNPLALSNMGLAYETSGRLDQAIACYREAVRVRPDYANAWRSLGAALDKLGRREEAAECFRRAQEPRR